LEETTLSRPIMVIEQAQVDSFDDEVQNS
jgi:hypothetical protein